MNILIIPDSHAHPDFPNDRSVLVGKLINDVYPEVVVNLGDQWDMPSLASYDKGKRSFHGRFYSNDIQAGVEFSEQLWEPVYKRKRRLPRSVYLIGNHEERIDRALELSPELEGTIGYQDLQLNAFYDDIITYSGNTPGQIEIEGVTFAHYLVSGPANRPISGEFAGRSLLSKRHRSTVVGHSHTFDYSVQPAGNEFIHGLVAGCLVDYKSPWAGDSQRYWRSGISVLRDVKDGDFSLNWYSLKQLYEKYK